jgi:hypothetical protein
MKIHLQHLLGSVVHDINGERAGRIEAARAEIRGEDCIITEWDLGPAALLSRLGIHAGRMTGFFSPRPPARVPWELLDVSDPKNPKLRCAIEDLPK